MLHFFNQLPHPISVILMAFLPFMERFALSVALLKYHMPIAEAFGLVVFTNMVPVFLMLFLAEKFHNWISAHRFLGKHWVRSVAEAQAKFARYEKYGLLGLLLFLSIPSPLNGAFTASVIAFILGYPTQKSLPYLLAGIVIGNFVVLLITLGAIRIF